MLKVLVALDGRSQSEIAKDARIKEGRLSEFLSGKKPMGPVVLRRIADALGVSVDLLASGKNLSLEDVRTDVLDKLEAELESDDSPTPIRPITRPDYTLARLAKLQIFEDVSEAEGRVPVPVFSERVAASDLERMDGTGEESQVYIPNPGHKAVFALQIFGESMNQDGIEPGDIVFVRRAAVSKPGRIVIYQQDGGVTIKRLGKGKLHPRSDRGFSDIEMTEGDANRIVGIVFGIHKPK